MTKTTPKTAPRQLSDDQIESVQGGLIGLLRTSDITDGTSNTATIVKGGPGTLVLSGSNTYGG